MNLKEKMYRAVSESGSVLLTGLDPDPDKIPDTIRRQTSDPCEQVFGFCKGIIEATAPHSCGYKLNLAFFEALGARGLEVFGRVREQIPEGKLIIADAKRGDIGNTASCYAHTFFQQFDCDFVTINPLMGMDSIEPFVGRPDKGVFALALTSNAGANDFFLKPMFDGRPLCTHISEKLSALQGSVPGVIGMVTGATQTENFNHILPAFPDAPLLIPGIGAQGGDINKLIPALENHPGLAFPSISRSIIYASGGKDWQMAAAEKAAEFKESFKGLIRHADQNA